MSLLLLFATFSAECAGSIAIFTISAEVLVRSLANFYCQFADRYLTVILRGRAGYELIYITNEAVGRVGYYQLISGKSEKNNC